MPHAVQPKNPNSNPNLNQDPVQFSSAQPTAAQHKTYIFNEPRHVSRQAATVGDGDGDGDGSGDRDWKLETRDGNGNGASASVGKSFGKMLIIFAVVFK